MKKHGEPLHVQAGMICVDTGFYISVDRISLIHEYRSEGVHIDFGRENYDNQSAVIKCTLPEFLAAMEEARKQLGGVSIKTQGDVMYCPNSTGPTFKKPEE